MESTIILPRLDENLNVSEFSFHHPELVYQVDKIIDKNPLLKPYYEIIKNELFGFSILKPLTTKHNYFKVANNFVYAPIASINKRFYANACYEMKDSQKMFIQEYLNRVIPLIQNKGLTS